MSRSRSFFKEFKQHSKHKLLILEQYFSAWGHKLGLRAGAGDTLLFVDACAGRGADEAGNEGSPLIAARAAAISQSNVRARRDVPFRIHVVAIESDRANYHALAELLSPFGEAVRALHGTLDDHLTELEREFPNTPALYFIDPFGLQPLQAGLVKRALAGEHHEALLLFADQAALRHFGAIAARETRAERRHREAIGELLLFPELAEERLVALADTAEDSRGSLNVTRENAVRILNTAFGDSDWLQVIEATAQHERRRAFLRLYSDRLMQWGASHVLRIPIVDETGTHAYTLIHASKSPKAYATMKEAVTYALDYSPLPATVVENMRNSVRCDLAVLEAAVRRRFASREIRWTHDRGDKGVSCVKNFVLKETGAFPFELPELKVRLNRFRLPGRAIVYRFPGEPTDVD
ncbi:MAG: three-Cys-motif partner protein TcmP [Proteobacteria bacterium]|nr:three-Cys-motif partner protein TcmP [Pseudomonadota bacterium]